MSCLPVSGEVQSAQSALETAARKCSEQKQSYDKQKQQLDEEIDRLNRQVQQLEADVQVSGFITHATSTTTTVLQPLHRLTCISWHLQLWTGVFYWCKVLLPACTCWWQPVHSDWGDAGVLHHSVIYAVSVPYYTTYAVSLLCIKILLLLLVY